MPPHRSDASAAAAPATTRSGRVKPVSKAALASGSSVLRALIDLFSLLIHFFYNIVASETHEHQQARRSRTGGKSARRSGANAQGKCTSRNLCYSPDTMPTRQVRPLLPGHPRSVHTLLGLGAPSSLRSNHQVTISGKAVRSSQRRRSPLRPLDNTSVTSQARPRPTSTHPPSLSLPRYSATRTITASTSFTTQGPRASATEQSLDILATAASSQRRQAPTSIPIADTTVAGNGVSAAAAEDCMEEDEVEDGEERHGDHRWRDDRDDSDEGNSDAYVPSDPGDGVEAGDAMDTGGDTDEDEDEDGGDTGNGRDEEVGDGEDEEDSGSKKGRARRHSKKTKKNPPKASDYSPEVEALLNHASGYMRSLVVSENPMPSVDDSIGLAADAFEVAKADRPHVDIPDEIAYISIVSISFFYPACPLLTPSHPSSVDVFPKCVAKSRMLLVPERAMHTASTTVQACNQRTSAVILPWSTKTRMSMRYVGGELRGSMADSYFINTSSSRNPTRSRARIIINFVSRFSRRVSSASLQMTASHSVNGFPPSGWRLLPSFSRL